MKKVYVFLAEGFEEMEAVTPIDLLRLEGTVALKQLPGGETVSVDADIVVMALGNRPDKAYEDKLAAAFDKVIVVGDATKAGTMADATKAAYEKCFYI